MSDAESENDREIRFDEFRKALTKVSIEHKIVISGCECCGSPSFEYMDNDQIDNSHYVDGKNSYLSWEKCEDEPDI